MSMFAVVTTTTAGGGADGNESETTTVIPMAVGALERMVRLAESGAYVGAVVQPTRRNEEGKNVGFTDQTLLHAACRASFIELCLSEPAADRPDDNVDEDDARGGSDRGDVMSRYLLGNAAPPASLMQRLLKLDPDAARCRDSSSFLPLHHFCQTASALSQISYGSVAGKELRARALRGAAAAARRLLQTFPAAATRTAGDRSYTPLAALLFTRKEGGIENRAMYRPLVAVLINAAPASLSVSNKAGLTPFDVLKRFTAARRASNEDVNQTQTKTREETTAGSSAETRGETHDPVAAFVTPGPGGERGPMLLKPSTIGLFREDLTASVDVSEELRVDQTKLRQRLEALQDRYLHLLVAPGQDVFARPRIIKPPPGSDALRGGGGGAAAKAATHADAAALLYAEDKSAHQGEHGDNHGSGGDDANDETEAAIRYRVEAIEAPLEALLPSDGNAPKPFSTPALFRMVAAPPGDESSTPLQRFELDRFGWTTTPVDSGMVDDVAEASGRVSPGVNVAFAREMDVLQEAKLVIDWACGKDGVVEGASLDGLDGEMVQEQEQEQEVVPRYLPRTLRFS